MTSEHIVPVMPDVVMTADAAAVLPPSVLVMMLTLPSAQQHQYHKYHTGQTMMTLIL